MSAQLNIQRIIKKKSKTKNVPKKSGFWVLSCAASLIPLQAWEDVGHCHVLPGHLPQQKWRPGGPVSPANRRWHYNIHTAWHVICSLPRWKPLYICFAKLQLRALSHCLWWHWGIGPRWQKKGLKSFSTSSDEKTASKQKRTWGLYF